MPNDRSASSFIQFLDSSVTVRLLARGEERGKERGPLVSSRTLSPLARRYRHTHLLSGLLSGFHINAPMSNPTSLQSCSEAGTLTEFILTTVPES